MQKIVSMEVGGRTFSLETGRMAKQASGAVVVRYGDSVILVTAVMNAKADPNKGFLPLLVEYREKSYAAGKIPGGFFKREGRPHERETLSARQIDRPLRPLFPEGFRNDVQIIASAAAHRRDMLPNRLAVTSKSPADIVTALKRFAASSNDARVRVLGSKNRLATVRPCSVTSRGGSWPSGVRYVDARSMICSICVRGRSAREIRWRRRPRSSVCDTVIAPAAIARRSGRLQGCRRRFS